MHSKSKALILLGIIYLAFISLGLPDGVLGVAWPSIRAELGLPLESVGILTTLLLCMSAFSSVISGKILSKCGTGNITFISGLLTGGALLGFFLSPNFIWLILCTIPLGLGQGAVDSGLNLYVAKHYTARQMNWLHCFWGVGASLGPLIMTQTLALHGEWRAGYRTVSVIQLSLSAILLISLLVRLWDKEPTSGDAGGGSEGAAGGSLEGISFQALAVLLFFLYSGIEFSCGIWINSLLVESRDIPVQLAGYAVTCFYAAIMLGRFFSGIAVNKIGNLRMIRLGLVLAAIGCILCVLSSAYIGILAGVAMVGMGLAPIYPCLMHETPRRFKKSVSDRLIGYQVGAACLGGSIISSGTGILLSRISLELLFPILIVMIGISFFANETIQRHYLKERGNASPAGSK